VLGQILLAVGVMLIGIVGGGWGSPASGLTMIAGVILTIAGASLLLAGIASLGGSLTPYPRPKDDASLREVGAYRFVRHPIYGGIVLLAFGWSCLTSPLALVPAAVLAVFLDRKARREETWLVERYPDYPTYRDRVHWRFVPGIR